MDIIHYFRKRDFLKLLLLCIYMFRSLFKQDEIDCVNCESRRPLFSMYYLTVTSFICRTNELYNRIIIFVVNTS